MSRPALTALFDPRSVAVIGASRDPSKVGGSVLANLRSAGFEGRVFPVNPRTESVQGLPAFASLLAVDGPVDLAVISVPAPAVLPALEECVAKGVPAAVVISAGFREAGEQGRQLEGELRAWLRHAPIRVLGPNCLGWIRPSRRLNVTFAPGMPAVGNIGFVSHSGALAVAILDWARDRRMGFSLFASLGNQADITESDVLDAVTHDEETRVIACYLEGVADGRRFFGALREAASMKPVVLLKAGRSAEGARAVSSHTGALAGSDRVFDAAVKQAGAVRAATVEELFDLARGLSSQRLPRGRRLLVVTNGGGLGVVSADAARESGLDVAPLDDAVRARLSAVLPSSSSVVNPVDLLGDADAARYSNALHAVGAQAADAALLILTAQAATDSVGVARAVIGTTRGWPIPVVAAFVGGARVVPGARTLEEAGIPTYAFPEPAVKTLGGMALVAERRRRSPSAPSLAGRPADALAHLASLQAAGRSRLGMLDLAPLLDAYGIPNVASRLAAGSDEAAEVARAMGFPVALKVHSADISHKSDVGGVRLGLRSTDEVAAATAQMLEQVKAARPDAVIEGVLVQRMVKAGQELLLGVVRDAQFGPTVMVGFGGIYVEVLKDTAIRLCPLDVSTAREMLGELRMAPLLEGFRGGEPVDMCGLSESICRLAQLAVDCPELLELELNPVIARGEGVIAVDGRGSLSLPQ
ncbi:MAG TPA: acetate--CoA ligase family protein [Candidatus Methylomirabilis sp.]|nr:acetate--CoA ligase family protein [Candidatus Methylomirabilis sp.]